MNGKQNRWILLSLFAGTAVGWVIGFLAIEYIRNPTFRSKFNPDYRTQASRFEEVLLHTESHYYDAERADYSSLTESAMSGMLSDLDRHSEFYPPGEFERLLQVLKMEYGGAGFRSRRFRGGQVVTRVFPKSPAAKAGLEKGDRVVSIDGESTSDWAGQKFHRKMKGPIDTEVVLKVVGGSGERTLHITRSRIKMESVDTQYVDSDGVGYVRILQFTEKTGADFAKVLTEMQKEEMTSLVLDLRGNQGGLVTAGVDVAGCFLPPGELVITAKTRGQDKDYFTEDRGVLVDLPMAILVNRFSMSASESLAGSLQYHNRAVLVGETTGGKGSGQNVRSLSRGSGIKITTTKYLLPDGNSVEGVGLNPDYYVSHNEEINLQLLLQRDGAVMIDPKTFQEQFGVKPIPDPMFLKAVEVLAEKNGGE